jgi:hypothetical protein
MSSLKYPTSRLPQGVTVRAFRDNPPLTTTNLGPLTTIFTPSPSCFTVIQPTDAVTYFEGGHGDAEFGIRCPPDEPSERPSLWGWPASGCYPSASDLPQPSNTLPVFSPGSSCPSGFATACQVAREGYSNDNPNDNPVFNIEETAFACCPR